jgi:hypothetical protein
MTTIAGTFSFRLSKMELASSQFSCTSTINKGYVGILQRIFYRLHHFFHAVCISASMIPEYLKR